MLTQYNHFVFFKSTVLFGEIWYFLLSYFVVDGAQRNSTPRNHMLVEVKQQGVNIESVEPDPEPDRTQLVVSVFHGLSMHAHLSIHASVYAAKACHVWTITHTIFLSTLQ